MKKRNFLSLLVLGVCATPFAGTSSSAMDWSGLSLLAQSQEQFGSGYIQVSSDAKGEQAQNFISQMGNTAIGFLSNASFSKEQKAKEFKKLLATSFDMKTIGRFAMGRYWKTATPDQQSQYLSLFERMVVDVYSTRFDDYKGQGFDVSGWRLDNKDYLVNSFIVPESGSKVKVDWRVRETGGTYKIIDVIIEGVSMSLTQRSDFASVIQRGGGNIDVLIDHLKK